MERNVTTQAAEDRAAVPYVFSVVVEPDEGRYYAEIPALPGCHTWGYSYEEAIQNIKEAAELWIEVKREAGEPIRLEAPAEIRKAKVTVGVLA
jgi:predicted RNase H-like HicB family nuclease